uniref:Putative DNA replication initiation protein n=1 Tax=viral metagenome TaxID=1070528 RepID=A0A6H1ZWK1_9ZZZZ
MIRRFERIEKIKKEVAKKWGYLVSDLEGPGRGKMLVYARHEAMYRVRKELPFSYPEIAHFFGRRDHTTIIYAVRTFEKKKEEIEKLHLSDGDSSNS